MTKLEEMNATVAEDLSHIPEGDYDFQGQLRMIYRMRRMNSLGKRPEGARTRQEVMAACTRSIGQPEEKLQFDREYFARH